MIGQGQRSNNSIINRCCVLWTYLSYISLYNNNKYKINIYIITYPPFDRTDRTSIGIKGKMIGQLIGQNKMIGQNDRTMEVKYENVKCG